MATPPAFSFQIHTCFLLGHFMLERSSHSINANCFPFTWGNLSARQLVWAGCTDLPSHGGDRTPWRPFRPVRAYVNSVDANFLLFFFYKKKSCHLPNTVSTKCLHSIKHTFKCDDTVPLSVIMNSLHAVTCSLPYLDLFSD